MCSFIRFAGAAAVVLSLGFLVAAIPSAVDVNVPEITGTDAVSLACGGLLAELVIKIKALLDCKTLLELEASLHLVAALLHRCAEALVKVGADVVVSVEAKANIVACVAAIITLLVKVCAELSVKFGLAVIVKLCAELDVAVKALLVALNICIPEILALITAALTAVVALFAQLQLKLCIGVLGLDL